MSIKDKGAIFPVLFGNYPTPPVLTTVFPGYGQIVLNRPKKLNPIIYEISQNLISFLEDCGTNNDIKFIILKGAGRAFCAGGDIQEMLEGITSDVKFVSNLHIGVYNCYRSIYMMATLKKPLITFMDGLTVGGGVGYAQVSAFKIATENTILSLPEAGIGHFIDAGNSFTFSRLDNQLGVYLILTGHPLYAEDVLLAGLATHFVKSENLDALQSALSRIVDNVSLDVIDATIRKFAVQQDHKAKNYTLHGEKLKTIERCFRYNTVEEIMEALEKENSKFARRCLGSMNIQAPTSLKLSLMLLREGVHRSYGKCMDHEYYYWRNLQFRHDYIEGMTAVKEKRRPQWNPANLRQINLQEELEKNNCLPLLAYPKNNANVDFTTSPYKKFVLPTVEDVEYVRKNYSLSTNNDVLNWFISGDQGKKYGVKQKLENILNMTEKSGQIDDFFAKL